VVAKQKLGQRFAGRVVVFFHFDAETVASGLSPMAPSQWRYDALGRVTHQRDAGRDWTMLTLDAAGNATDTARRAAIRFGPRITRPIASRVALCPLHNSRIQRATIS